VVAGDALGVLHIKAPMAAGCGSRRNVCTFALEAGQASVLQHKHKHVSVGCDHHAKLRLFYQAFARQSTTGE
jgi:hypothetical protein